MSIVEKEISFSITNTYSTLFTLTKNTKNVWIVCHGLGYLSRYFIKHFNFLNPEENYVIAPQAHSKYYQSTNFKHVGASWLTKENTETEIENVLKNLDAIFKTENIPDDKNLIILGFSQGVSISTRWVIRRKIKCIKLIIFSGGLPNEFVKSDVDFLLKNKTEVYFLYGNNDEYITPKREKEELNKLNKLFGNYVTIRCFNGKHELRTDILEDIK
ncbi:alpha/beta hydrolase [Abyssalbus ytuae]|uniref:Esterase n=1 Tax=Abyssalbus ytuae TaxID=2926907 RepID=A0A9E6ZY31_9FLAO|nr:esterase [Abyssalbus ytuae]UOB17302.1 esterase [Abyssalbus ytuae]